jgi:hypothetical protein
MLIYHVVLYLTERLNYWQGFISNKSRHIDCEIISTIIRRLVGVKVGRSSSRKIVC